jgi:hypothetical protein
VLNLGTEMRKYDKQPWFKLSSFAFAVPLYEINGRMPWLIHRWLTLFGISVLVFKGKVSYNLEKVYREVQVDFVNQ